MLNLTYNALLDGVRLEDIELRRNDEAFLYAGAQRIPPAPAVFPVVLAPPRSWVPTVRRFVLSRGFLTDALIYTVHVAPTFDAKGHALSYRHLGYCRRFSLPTPTSALSGQPSQHVVSHEAACPVSICYLLVAPHACNHPARYT